MICYAISQSLTYAPAPPPIAAITTDMLMTVFILFLVFMLYVYILKSFGPFRHFYKNSQEIFIYQILFFVSHKNVSVYWTRRILYIGKSVFNIEWPTNR